MMARLLREKRSGSRVAAKLSRVVSLIPRKVAHKVRREYMLPRDRHHIVIGSPSLVLPFLLLVGKVGHIESLIACEQIQAEEIFLAGSVVEFEEAFYRPPIVVKVLNRRRVKKAVRCRTGGADEITELARVAAYIKRSFKRRKASSRQRHAAGVRNLKPRARSDCDDSRELVTVLRGNIRG